MRVRPFEFLPVQTDGLTMHSFSPTGIDDPLLIGT